MRDKIKLKSRPKNLRSITNKEEKTESNNEFNYDNKITLKLKENDLESRKYNEKIVIYIYIILFFVL